MGKDIRETFVMFQTSLGLEMRATVVRLNRFQVVFEVCAPSAILRVSEVLTHFKIVINEYQAYAGRAVVRNLMGAGAAVICEAVLEETLWIDVEFAAGIAQKGNFSRGFVAFIEEWQKIYRVSSDYKIIVADMQSFFAQLHHWMEQVELGIRSSPSGDRLDLEQRLAAELLDPVVDAMNALFEKFETIAGGLDEEVEAVHRSYARQHLHPWVMCGPFPYRAFTKPLGYAGDYETIDMMLRNSHEGSSLFAKIVNAWFLRQAPAQAHRNRIDYLNQKLLTETLRVSRANRHTRILNIACGPAHEVERFLREQPLSSMADFTLLDFNQETLDYVRGRLSAVSADMTRNSELRFVKRSVQSILKETARRVERASQDCYDVIYCAGLFDYLSDPICRRLLSVMYEWLSPGGLLIATNVDPGNPMRKGMEHLLDWHLLYRTGPQLLALKPQQADADAASICSDDSGVNVFLEVRKSDHV